MVIQYDECRYMHCPYGLFLSNNSCSGVDGEAKIESPGSTNGGARKDAIRLGGDNATDSGGEGSERTFDIDSLSPDEDIDESRSTRGGARSLRRPVSMTC